MAVRFVTFWLLVFVCMASGCKKDDEEVFIRVRLSTNRGA